MKCIVVGLGQFGWATAIELAKQGAEVIVMDLDMGLVDRIKDQVSLAIRADATQTEVLEEHGARECDVLVAAIGDDFEAQLLVTVHAKKLGVRKIVARATTSDHGRILEAVGATLVLNPESEGARVLVQRLVLPGLSSYLELAEGFSVMELAAPAGMVGHSLRELDLTNRYKINLIAIKRVARDARTGGSYQELDPVPGADTLIRAGDVLAMVGSDTGLAQIMAKYGERDE